MRFATALVVRQIVADSKYSGFGNQGESFSADLCIRLIEIRNGGPMPFVGNSFRAGKSHSCRGA